MTSEEPSRGKDLEEALLRIPGLKAVRFVTDPGGRPLEVHIVAEGGPGTKTAKQIVRDVQTVALATFGLQLDHRIVSVVQFPHGEVSPVMEARPKIEEITVRTYSTKTAVRVVLSKEEMLSTGEAAGFSSPENLARLAGEATLDALMGLLQNGVRPALEQISLQRLGGRDIAFATVNLGPGTSTLSGSAVVEVQQAEAAVRAVLDALNRRLWNPQSAVHR